MTSKRKKRSVGRRKATRSAEGSSAPVDGSAVTTEGAEAPAEESEPTPWKSTDGAGESQERPRRGLGAVPSPYPPFAESVAAGLRAAGSWPTILAVAFIGEVALWGAFVGLGATPLAGHMAGLMSLPPVHVLIDVQLVQVTSEGTAELVLVALAVVAVRAVVLGLLSALLVDALRRGAPSFRAALRRLPRIWASLVQFYVIEVFLVLAAPTVLGLLAGPQFAQLGTILALIFGLHFLVMTPVVVAAEDVPASDALRWSVRAARLPGLRHLGLVLAYFFLTVQVLIPASSVGLRPATPSFLVWVFVLVVTFVHVSVLGALAYRWLAVRDEPVIREGRSASASSRKQPATGKRTSGSSSKSGGKPKRRR